MLRTRHVLPVALLALAGCSSPAPAPAVPAAPAPVTTSAAAATSSPNAGKINLQVDACADLGKGDSRDDIAERIATDYNVTEPEAQRAIDAAVAADGLCPYNRAAAQ